MQWSSRVCFTSWELTKYNDTPAILCTMVQGEDGQEPATVALCVLGTPLCWGILEQLPQPALWLLFVHMDCRRAQSGPYKTQPYDFHGFVSNLDIFIENLRKESSYLCYWQQDWGDGSLVSSSSRKMVNREHDKAAISGRLRCPFLRLELVVFAMLGTESDWCSGEYTGGNTTVLGLKGISYEERIIDLNREIVSWYIGFSIRTCFKLQGEDSTNSHIPN